MATEGTRPLAIAETAAPLRPKLPAPASARRPTLRCDNEGTSTANESKRPDLAASDRLSPGRTRPSQCADACQPTAPRCTTPPTAPRGTEVATANVKRHPAADNEGTGTATESEATWFPAFTEGTVSSCLKLTSRRREVRRHEGVRRTGFQSPCPSARRQPTQRKLPKLTMLNLPLMTAALRPNVKVTGAPPHGRHQRNRPSEHPANGTSIAGGASG